MRVQAIMVEKKKAPAGYSGGGGGNPMGLNPNGMPAGLTM